MRSEMRALKLQLPQPPPQPQPHLQQQQQQQPLQQRPHPLQPEPPSFHITDMSCPINAAAAADDDDDFSISSNDIKDILTNITAQGASVSSAEDDEGEPGDKERSMVSRVRTIDVGEEKDLRLWERSKLLKLKYDVLRNFLRTHGVHMKGTKEELSDKIKELPLQDTAPTVALVADAVEETA